MSIPLAEPMTMITDYALATQGALLGSRLARAAHQGGQTSVGLFSAALLATALAAAVGGTSHGFAPYLTAPTEIGLWLVTYGSIGLANLCFLAGGLWATLAPPSRSWLLAGAAAQCAVYGGWIASHRDFRYVVYNGVVTLAALLLLGLGLRRRGEASGGWILAGVGVSLLAALVQQGRLALHPQFNHNDLFHVVQMAGLYLFYRAARSLRDRSAG